MSNKTILNITILNKIINIIDDCRITVKDWGDKIYIDYERSSYTYKNEAIDIIKTIYMKLINNNYYCKLYLRWESRRYKAGAYEKVMKL